jgi:hypothetical protein
MARISNYERDTQITGDDKLLGSSYEGEGVSGPIYETKNFKVSNLASYLNLVFTVDEVNYNLNDVISSVASANQSITLVANELEAAATFQTNLASSFGTYDEEGNILTFSSSTADQILGTANTSAFAQASFVNNLASSFGTYNQDGSINTLSSSFANSVLSTANTAEFAQASFVTNLASSLGTTDAQGNLTISVAFANQVLQTETTTDYAESSFVTNLASSIGTVDAQGNLTVSEAFANSVLNTETTSDFASAESVTTLTTTVGNIPRIYRQDEPPSVSETPIGSLWFDTNDNNKSYVLVSGTPNVWTTVQDQEFTQFKASATQTLGTLTTDTGALSTKVTNLNSVLEILDENGDLIPANQAAYFDTITTYVDQNSATASSVSTLTATIGDENSGLVSSVNTNQSAIATVNGKLTASYGISVDAGGRVAGLKLLADGTTGSEFIARADEFGVDMPNGTRVMTVDTNGLVINGSGTFSGALSAASGTFAGSLSAATGTFAGTLTAGLVEIESNNITLGADTGYSTVANISFLNPSDAVFARFRAYSGDFGDGLQIVGGPSETLDGMRFESQAMFQMPGSTTFATNQGVWAAGTISTRWQSASIRAVDSVAIGIGPQGGADTGYLSISTAASGLVIPSLFSLTSTGFITMSANSGNSLFTIAGSTITLDGNVTVTGTLTEGSDESIKTNIETLQPLSIDVRWVKYNPKNNLSETRYGVVAQELEANHPELVRSFEKDGQEFKSVAYIDLLVAKIAELEARIKQLEVNG